MGFQWQQEKTRWDYGAQSELYTDEDLHVYIMNIIYPYSIII